MSHNRHYINNMRFWLAILAVSLSLFFIEKGVETSQQDRTESMETTTESALLDAWAEQQAVSRKYLSDAMASSANVIMTARQYTLQSAKVQNHSYKSIDILKSSSRTIGHDSEFYCRNRFTSNTRNGVISGSMSDYITASLKRIII